MTKQYDVAVAGAGLAGLQVARLLGARGLRVLLLDRRTSLAAPVYTTGIFVGSPAFVGSPYSHLVIA